MEKWTSAVGPGTDADPDNSNGKLEGQKKPVSNKKKKSKQRVNPQIDLEPTIKTVIESAIERLRSLPVEFHVDASRELAEAIVAHKKEE